MFAICRARPGQAYEYFNGPGLSRGSQVWSFNPHKALLYHTSAGAADVLVKLRERDGLIVDEAWLWDDLSGNMLLRANENARSICGTPGVASSETKSGVTADVEAHSMESGGSARQLPLMTLRRSRPTIHISSGAGVDS